MFPSGSQDRRTDGCALAPTAQDPLAQGGLKWIRSPNPGQDQDPSSCSFSGYDPQDTRMAEKGESASTQAVKRGHKVFLEEIPDEEDDTSF